MRESPARPAEVVALDIGGTSIKAGRVASGQPVGEVAVVAVDRDAPRDVLIDTLATAVRAAGGGPTPIAAAVPDPFDHAEGVSWMTHKFAGLYGVPIAPLLERALEHRLAMRWCNDAAAAVAGEALAGAAAGQRTVLGVTLGTGLGAALIRDGTVVTRVDGFVVGELWQQSLADGRLADTAFAARTLRMAEHAGVAARFGTELGALLAPVAAAASADVVVVGGGGAGSFDAIVAALADELPVPVARATLGAWAPLVGAAHLCWPETG